MDILRSLIECAAQSGVREIAIDMMHYVAESDRSSSVSTERASSQVHTQTMRIILDDMQVLSSLRY